MFPRGGAEISIRIGDCRQRLSELANQSIECCVTSPPYFGLRDYGHDGQIGLEQTPEAFVAELVCVFREVKRVLRDDGTLWLILGDSFCNTDKWGGGGGNTGKNTVSADGSVPSWAVRKKRAHMPGLKPKDLIGIPWRVAFALQADGWFLRQWLPWVKRNPMPESVTDRPTSACEIVFMLTKSADYVFDYQAVKRGMKPSSLARLDQDIAGHAGSNRANGNARTDRPMKAVKAEKQRGHSRRHEGFNARWDQMERGEQSASGRAFRNSDLFYDSLTGSHGAILDDEMLVALDVATQPFSGAHFATFPPHLIEPLIRASCPAGGTVLDPFGGAGTTGLVAARLGRNAVLTEINPEYAQMAAERIRADARSMSDVRLMAAPTHEALT